MGYSLNYDEKFQLENLLKKVQEKGFEEIQFVAKIKGTDFDYYVLAGRNYTGSLEFPKETFFYASSKNFTLSEIPASLSDANDLRTQKSDEFDELFVGNPEHRYGVVLNEEGEEVEAKKDDDKKPEDEEDEAEKERRRYAEPLTELERLAVVTKSILHDCAIVPKGCLRLTPNHELRFNSQWVFQESNPEATDLNVKNVGLEDWLHFRYVDSKEKRNMLNLGESIFRNDFLDTLDKDIPQGQWSVQRNWDNTVVYVKNLLWPGFVAYARVGTNETGFFYWGQGLKIKDLPFLI